MAPFDAIWGIPLYTDLNVFFLIQINLLKFNFCSLVQLPKELKYNAWIAYCITNSKTTKLANGSTHLEYKYRFSVQDRKKSKFPSPHIRKKNDFLTKLMVFSELKKKSGNHYDIYKRMNK